MTIEQLGSIGELLAAIATMATLIYLAIQIRGSNAATRAEARRSMDLDSNETVRVIASDPDLTKVFLLGLSRPESLSREDSFRVRLLMSHFFTLQDTGWKEVRLGTMTEQELAESVNRSRPWIESPGGIWWWQANASIFSDDFKKYIEKEVPSLCET